MRLTPALIRKAYEFIIETPPFDKYLFPDSEGITFKVSRADGHFGQFIVSEDDKLVIELSDKIIGHTDLLMMFLAHEIIHLYQHLNKLDSARTQHNAQFKKMAAKVCLEHGYDLKAFI